MKKARMVVALLLLAAVVGPPLAAGKDKLYYIPKFTNFIFFESDRMMSSCPMVNSYPRVDDLGACAAIGCSVG